MSRKDIAVAVVAAVLSLIVGAILGSVKTSFDFQGRISTLETRIEYLMTPQAAQVTQEAQRVAAAVAATQAAAPTATALPLPNAAATSSAAAQEVAKAVMATLTSQPTWTATPSPTATSAPTHTPTLTPAPQARIQAPGDGERVPVNATVLVEYKGMPADRHLWVVVRIPTVNPVPPAWWVFPQLVDRRAPPPAVGAGTLKVPATFGGDADRNAPFNVVLLLANEGTQRRLMDYVAACGPNPDLCRGIQLADSEIDVLDFATVTRQ